MKNGDIILSGYFENSQVTGKGLKKWRQEGTEKN